MIHNFNARKMILNRSDVVPDHIPADAIIFNAPRPLLGECWEGEFISGIFYAAITDDTPYRESLIGQNKSLDAAVLIFVPEAEALKMVQEYLITEGYGEIESDLFEEFWQDCFYDNLSRSTIEIG